MMDGLVNIYKENIIGMNLFSSPDQLITQIMNNPLLGIVILNNDLEIIECNEAASYFLELSTKDKRNSIDKCRGEVAELAVNMILAVRVEKTPHETTLKFVRNNKNHLIHICVTLLTDSTFKSSGFCIMITNVDDESGRKANWSSEKQLNEPMINYIVSQVKTISESLMSQCHNNDISKEDILTDATKMTKLTSFADSCRELSAEDAKWCYLQQSVDDALKAYNKLNSNNPLNITYKLRGMCVMGGADATTMFKNLLIFSKNNGANNISITGCIKSGTLIINYIDDGIGIPKEKKDEITNDDPNIFGPELYIVGKYLKIHGFMYQESGIPGEGFDIQIMIPPSKYSITFE
jgi:hypothetical protein